METKYIVFFLTLIFGVPSAILILRASARLRQTAIFLLVFMIPFIYTTGINFYTDMFYRGTARGFEVLAVDMISLVLVGTLLFTREYRFDWKPPGTVLYLIYFLFSCISIINAESVMYSGYEVMKMLMMLLYFLALYNSLRYTQQLRAVLTALSCVVILCTAYMLLQKYFMGIYQPAGLFPHRNGAAMFANMMGGIFLALLFNAKLSRGYFWLYFASFASAALMVVMALSRGALFFFPISCIIVTIGSFLNGANERKWKLLGLLSLLGTLAILKAATTVIDRFENAPEQSTTGRVQLAHAALNMAEDKFFGVGLNNWGIKINPPYLYSEGTGMERPSLDYKSGLVETIYLLVAAECGWIGFASLVVWLSYYYVQAFLNARRYAQTPLFYLPLGILGGLTAVLGQSTLEWILKQPTNFYALMTVFAMIAVLTKGWRTRRKRARA